MAARIIADDPEKYLRENMEGLLSEHYYKDCDNRNRWGFTVQGVTSDGREWVLIYDDCYPSDEQLYYSFDGDDEATDLNRDILDEMDDLKRDLLWRWEADREDWEHMQSYLRYW